MLIPENIQYTEKELELLKAVSKDIPPLDDVFYKDIPAYRDYHAEKEQQKGAIAGSVVVGICFFFWTFFSVEIVKAEAPGWQEYAYSMAQSYNLPTAEIDQLLSVNLDGNGIARLGVEIYDLSWQEAYLPEIQGEVLVMYFTDLKAACRRDRIPDPVICATERIETASY